MRETITVPFSPRNDHTVSVTLDDAVLAATAAFADQIERANVRRKRKNKQGLTATGKESLALRIRGLSGEAALAQYLGVPPVRMADEWRHRPDVLCFDCLTTDKAHGALIITPRDRLDMMKVLVIDRSPVFHICGWYRASDARLEAERRHSEWWRTEREDGGAWYIPQAYLRSLSDEEAQRELARHYRQWTGTRYVNLRPIIEMHTFVEQSITNAAMPVAGQGYVPDAAVHDADTTDWREVLRRAGAAPPEEE